MLPEALTDTPTELGRLSRDERVPMKSPTTSCRVAVIEIPDVVLYPIMLAADGVVPPMELPELVIKILQSVGQLISGRIRADEVADD